ncbi:bleomycin resistance family protein [Sulfurimonas lithotrophica]|uniref:Bleomycin resistance family protein n=1 Tax=Sulfurimonas lithotrophica TaxID=2590022 RepID=A0A5P8P2W4_9BACT|nr:VOC family protein [Sulfurimonas lithotrophica]QFR49996.1 bleomycin resistance family protein [Sulfurimonas lithotrophica]
MKSLVPNLAVKNIKDTVSYYEKNFNFKLQMAVDISKDGFDNEIKDSKEYIWAMVTNGGVSLMFQSEDSIKDDIGSFYPNIGASLSLYIDVENLEELYSKLKDEVEIYKSINTTWYGQKEFYVKDINGYILAFSSKS